MDEILAGHGPVTVFVLSTSDVVEPKAREETQRDILFPSLVSFFSVHDQLIKNMLSSCHSFASGNNSVKLVYVFDRHFH